MATLASSPQARHSLASCFLRSPVGLGNGRRMTMPSLEGVMPRSDCEMAFSMAFRMLLSYGSTTSIVPSATRTPASCEIFIEEP